MEASPYLSLVDPSTGELADYPTLKALEVQVAQLKEDVENAEGELRQKRSQITRLRNELSQALGVEPEAEQIVEVLSFWRDRIKPRAVITVGGERWLKVRARLRDKDVTTKRPCYTPLHLKAAVVGALLSPDHVENGWLDAVTIFKNEATTGKHIERATTFRRTYGESALLIVDELAGESLRWLAERCACGALWLEHLRGGPAPEGLQPCERTGCTNFDAFSARVDRFMREQG